jgi:hypothetical protein
MDMTEEEILERAREIDAARLGRAREANKVRKIREREQAREKFRQRIEAVFDLPGITDDQLNLVITAAQEYNDSMEWL